MKAAITKDKLTLVVEDKPIPELKPEQALVQVKYSGICGTDAHIYAGTFPNLNYPLTPGHEFVGRLVEINSENPVYKDFEKGDWVVAQPYFSCNVCETCSRGGDNYCSSIKVHGVHVDGSFAEYVVVPAKKLMKVTKTDNIKRLVLTEPLAVGVHAVNKGELRPGNSVFILGGGIIGIMIALAARINGASQIVVCDISDFRLDFVRSLGFDAMDSRDPDFFEKLMAKTNGKGFDNVFEATGSAFGISMMTKAAGRGAIIVQAGITSLKHPIDVRAFSDKEIQVRGIRIHSQFAFARALGILERGVEAECFDRLITDVYPLEQAEEAFKYQIASADHFKVICENTNM